MLQLVSTIKLLDQEWACYLKPKVLKQKVVIGKGTSFELVYRISSSRLLTNPLGQTKTTEERQILLISLTHTHTQSESESKRHRGRTKNKRFQKHN